MCSACKLVEEPDAEGGTVVYVIVDFGKEKKRVKYLPKK